MAASSEDPEKTSGKGEEKSGWQLPEPSITAGHTYRGPVKKYGSDVEKGAKAKPESKNSLSVSSGPLYKQAVDGAIHTTKEGADDKAYISLGQGEASVEALNLDYNILDGEAGLTVVEAKAKGSVVEAKWGSIEDDIAEFFGFGKSKASGASSGYVAGGFGPFAARLGDPTSHGTPLAPGSGSPNVLIGGRPAWRTMIDFHTCPVVYPPPHVGGVVMKGAATVFINYQMACRAGDIVLEIPGGPNPIVSGCPTVLIGEASGGGMCTIPETGHDWFDLDAEADVLTAEAEAKLGLKYKDGSLEAEAKAGAMAAVAKGEIGGKFRIPIPFTDYSFTVGGTAKGSVASIGAEIGGSLKVNSKDPKTGKRQIFKSEWGGEVAAGLGLGLDFSLGLEEN